MRFEVLTAVRMATLFFWTVTPCRLVGRYQRFGEIHRLHLQWVPKMEVIHADRRKDRRGQSIRCSSLALDPEEHLKDWKGVVFGVHQYGKAFLTKRHADRCYASVIPVHFCVMGLSCTNVSPKYCWATELPRMGSAVVNIDPIQKNVYLRDSFWWTHLLLWYTYALCCDRHLAVTVSKLSPQRETEESSWPKHFRGTHTFVWIVSCSHIQRHFRICARIQLLLHRGTIPSMRGAGNSWTFTCRI
jgi:hypothetical protein